MSKEYCFKGFFKVYYIRGFPFKYITQNKDIDELKDSCFKELLSSYKSEELNGVYFALTNDIIIKKIKDIKGMKRCIIPLPYKLNINGLKKYLVGEYTRCGTCEEKCSCKNKVMGESKNKECYFVVFLVKR
jgi:hypothetical protein